MFAPILMVRSAMLRGRISGTGYLDWNWLPPSIPFKAVSFWPDCVLARSRVVFPPVVALIVAGLQEQD